jgi:hypothetical protein
MWPDGRLVQPSMRYLGSETGLGESILFFGLRTEQFQELMIQFWAQWLLFALQNTPCFLFSNRAKVLTVFVPLGVFAGAIHLDPVPVFVLSFLAIMTLVPILSFANKRLSASVGYVLGELIHAMFGNAVEMTVGQNQPVIIPRQTYSYRFTLQH